MTLTDLIGIFMIVVTIVLLWAATANTSTTWADDMDKAMDEHPEWFE